jgi:hypothetical protein
MEKLEKYLSNCYLEKGKDCVLVYKLVKVNEKYGLLCHEAQIKPYEVWIYEDFPQNQDFVEENGYTFLESFIPEICKDCEAKAISESHYIELITRIQDLYNKKVTIENQIKSFIEQDGLGEKV